MNKAILFFLSVFSILNGSEFMKEPMLGEFKDRTLFENPYANIPAQCYIETSYGTQNACLFCHSNAASRIKLGNTLSQAGLNPKVGNLQTEYAFGPATEFTKNPNINPWKNIIDPKSLDDAFKKLGTNTNNWDMQKYIKEDNWQQAYDTKKDSKAFRLFPNLNPKSLPADSDGFVRTLNVKEAVFKDHMGPNTGWRAVNFIPYGIFTPYSGSVSGIYIKLAKKFMQNKNGKFDLNTYKRNLTLLERAIQDRLETSDKYYVGEAKTVEIERGLFPLGTQFAHPLHYVDVQADEQYTNNKFPGLRSNRVKEIRYMYKYQMYYPDELVTKEEDAPLYYNEQETWIDNGAGWYMAGFIENKNGELRGQNPEELLSCIGCHSSTYGFEPEQFTSGTGNTIDTVWAFPRKLPNDLGWKEMNYFGYKQNKQAKAHETSGHTQMGDPINKEAKIGEFRYFLDHVVGASLYGDMPKAMEQFLQSKIVKKNGYSSDFPSLDLNSVLSLKRSQKLRLKLIREFTAKKDYLNAYGNIHAELLYPSLKSSLETAKGYRKIVATQRYRYGKDYFKETPFTYKYYRDKKNGFTHIDGTPYKFGETITDRPYDTSETILKGVGTTLT
ncbi:MAG: hypothetical protein U9N30_05655, partial [Campylobacterota bacterium]|nr:hypothetical protein [Campylobacterota bacterium]